ncbi:hypothetical protein E2C01_100884 [Portunus trituberculatus]|uniref:CCHC-type domain-containing protein n=1 Tax=Portunus trituberculatus TaxID=210409 RepID=A0A5B7K966_PORTR|nr:hypothetical protein [Portunus trituberculatus]
MVDIASLPRPKQLIQLRMCLSLETQSAGAHATGASKLHFSRRRGGRYFPETHQGIQQRGTDKSLSEEIDVCILTGVQDEQVVQKIIALDAAATLADVVTLCRSYEATRTTASALRAPPGVRAVSQYRKDKKTDHRTKADAHSAVSSPHPSCSNCGKQQHGPKGCPDTEAVCHGCGITGHWSHTEKCPAKTV